MSDDEHQEHIAGNGYDEDCRACSAERNALIAELNRTADREPATPATEVKGEGR